MSKIFIIIAFLILLTPVQTLALPPTGSLNGQGGEPVVKPKTDNAVTLPNPLSPDGKTNPSIQVLLGKIISNILGVVGSLALVMFIYGGVTWMLSAGNQERVTKGKQILIWATVGIVVIFTAYALVKFVLTTVTGAA